MIAFTPELRLLDDGDTPWISELLAIVERSIGEPWRVLLERIDHAALFTARREVPRYLRSAVVNALRRVLGGASARARIARRVRARVLGHPALDRMTRDARIAAAAAELGLEPSDLETLLWADLARERPVVLPGGRPEPRILAALANVERIQREMRRASEIDLRLWDREREIVQMAARCGLITSATRDGDSIVLHITGPLALFYDTTIYGRALGALVPILAEHDEFELAIRTRTRTTYLEPPLLLPPYTPRLKPSIADRLARDLDRGGLAVERDPSPITVGEHVLFPDLVIDGIAVEVLGFATSRSITARQALYREARRAVILCVDAKRIPDDVDTHGLVAYSRNVTAAEVVARLPDRSSAPTVVRRRRGPSP